MHMGDSMNGTHPNGDGISSDRLWLKNINIKNFRCFDELSIDFHRQLTVLIARNGLGKTAVLDAIVTLFGTFVGSFYNGQGKGIDVRDVRLAITNQIPLEMEPQYSTILSANGEIFGEQIEWSRNLNSPKSGTTIKDAKSLTDIAKFMQLHVTENKPVTLPIIAYYGTGRLWSHKKKTGNKLFKSGFFGRTSGYQDCLDPASSYKYFEDWFQNAAKGVADYRLRKNESRIDVPIEERYSELLDVIKQAVNVCLAPMGWRDIRYSFFHQALVMEHADYGLLEVGQLSDGVRNMVAMVADIAYRIVQLNSYLRQEAARRTPGLVLIDEVDMHLHPEWQQIVLGRLMEAFPMVQFVVTTHSPQVVSTITNDNIRLLAKNINNRFIAYPPAARSFGRSSADVLQSIMDVDPLPQNEETRRLRSYLSSVEQDDLNKQEWTQLREELNQIFGPDHPFLMKADMVIRRRRVLGQ